MEWYKECILYIGWYIAHIIIISTYVHTHIYIYTVAQRYNTVINEVMYFKWNKIAKTYRTYGTFCFMEFRNFLITKRRGFSVHSQRQQQKKTAICSKEFLYFGS